MNKYIYFTISMAVLGSGCTRGLNGLPTIGKQAPVPVQVESTIVPSSVIHETYTKAVVPKKKPAAKSTKVKYVAKKSVTHKLKPEPYSIGSGKKDPELLGPETTIKREPKPTKGDEVAIVNIKEVDLTKKTVTKSKAKVKIKESKREPVKKKSTTMGKSECITMVGESKFKSYAEKFGGESGAIKRCAILKRLKRK